MNRSLTVAAVAILAASTLPGALAIANADDTREMRTFPVGGEPKEYCPVHSPFRPGAND